jgi:hypothetical protein
LNTHREILSNGGDLLFGFPGDGEATQLRQSFLHFAPFTVFSFYKRREKKESAPEKEAWMKISYYSSK